MKKRMFLASKGTNAITVVADITPGQTITADRKDRNLDMTTIEGLELSTRDIATLTTMRALNAMLDELKVTKITDVIDVYITSNTAKALNNGWHKFWILSGTYSLKAGEKTPKKVPAVLVEEFKTFEKLYAKKGLYLRIREIGECKPNGNLNPVQISKLTASLKLNYVYATRLWEIISPKTATNIQGIA